MARIAAVTLPLTGHMNPMVTTLRALQSRGHTVCVFGPPDVGARLPQDIAFRSIAADIYPLGALDSFTQGLRDVSGYSGLQHMIRSISQLSKAYLDALPNALMRWGANALIHDQLEPGAGLVAKGLRRNHNPDFAHISLAAALPINREPDVPPPYLGWKYRDSDYGRWLNAGGYRVVDWLMRSQAAVLSDGAARLNLRAPVSGQWDISACTSEVCDLSQSVPLLDYPRKRHGSPTYIGPIREKAVTPRYTSYADIANERDGRPLVFGSLGTLMGGRKALFTRMAKACTANGLQLVIAHAGQLDAAAQAALPRDVIIRDYVDQGDILKHSVAAIVHGGYNTVLDAMQAGKPILVRPIAFEQSAIAARVDRLGAGIRVSPLRSWATDLHQLTTQSQYRLQAEKCARQIAFAGGAGRAARYIEDVLSGETVMHGQEVFA